jgi:hypothetical protein
MARSRIAFCVAFVIAGFGCLFGGCGETGGRPTWMEVIAGQSRPGVISVSLSVTDVQREIRVAGKALITVEEYSATDSGYAVTTIYRKTKDIKSSDFRWTPMLLGGRSLCDLGDIRSEDIENWQKTQKHPEPLNTGRVRAVRVEFATNRGVTLNASDRI